MGDGNVDKHNTINSLSSPLDRRASDLALQRRLGLLPERRFGSGTQRYIGVGGNRTLLTEMVPLRRTRRIEMTFRLARLLVMIPILGSIALMSAASAAMPAHGQSACPSKFDYLVLASFADSSNLLAMSAYRAPKQESQAD
jgi:hypothetical protein